MYNELIILIEGIVAGAAGTTGIMLFFHSRNMIKNIDEQKKMIEYARFHRDQFCKANTPQQIAIMSLFTLFNLNNQPLSHRFIAKATHLGLTVTVRTMKELEEMKFIRVKRRPSKSSIYEVNS